MRLCRGWGWRAGGSTLLNILNLPVTATPMVCRWELLEQACQLKQVRLSQQQHIAHVAEPRCDSHMLLGCRWQLLEDACQPPRHGKLSQEERKARRDILNKRRLEAAVAAGGEAVLTSRNAKLLSVDVPADDSDAEDSDSDIGGPLLHMWCRTLMDLEATPRRTLTSGGF